MDYVLNAAYASLLLMLVALGLAVIFGVMGVINLAHGEFLMLGAYGAVVTRSVVGSFWLSLLLVPAAVAVIGVLIERVLIRPLYRRPLETIVATFGLAIIIREVVREIAGSDFRNVDDPVRGSVSILGAAFPTYRLVVMGSVVTLVVGIYLLQSRTRLGLIARAVIQSPELAGALGIDVNVVYRATFALGAALAAAAGVLVAPTVNVFPDMGSVFVISAFLAVLVGGLGSLRGLAAAVILLGAAQYALSQIFTPVAGAIGLLILAIGALRFLPDGLARVAGQ